MKVMPFCEPDVMATLRMETSNELQNIGGPQPTSRVRLMDGISSRDKMGESLVGEQEARELRLSGTLKPVDMESGKDVDSWDLKKPEEGNPRRGDGTVGPLSVRAGEMPQLHVRKIRQIKPKNYDSFLNGEVGKNQIVLVAVLQMWQPESRSIRTMMVRPHAIWGISLAFPGQFSVILGDFPLILGSFGSDFRVENGTGDLLERMDTAAYRGRDWS